MTKVRNKAGNVQTFVRFLRRGGPPGPVSPASALPHPMHTARRAGQWPCRAGGAKGCAVRESEGLLLEGGLLSGADDGLVVGLIFPSQFFSRTLWLPFSLEVQLF